MNNYPPKRTLFRVRGENIVSGHWQRWESNVHDNVVSAQRHESQVAERADYRHLSIVALVEVEMPLNEYRQGEPLSYLEGIEVCGFHPDPNWVESDVGNNMTYVVYPDSIPAEVAATVIRELRRDCDRLNSEGLRWFAERNALRKLIDDAVKLFGGAS